MRIIFIGFMLLTLTGCTDDTVEQEEPVRGLRTFQVANATQSVERRYPSVIQPHDETRLAFEVGGQLQAVNLAEGQTVELNDVLLKLNASTFQLQVQESETVVAQATAAYRNGRSNFDRQSELWEKRMIPRSAFDDAKAAVDTARAQLEQSKKRFEIAQDNLAKTELRAPFDGIIASVVVDSFATISAGQRTLTLYAENAFEAAFTVPSSVINSLSLGQAVRMLVSDLPKTVYSGRITELGSRASEVSAFPVVAVLDDAPVDIKPGMSAEVAIDIALPQSVEGFMIPITCFAFNTVKQLNPDRTDVPVFIFDPETSTVRERKVDVFGVRENMVIVRTGLNAGDLVASAGVSYLRDGQRVHLLSNE